MDSREKKIFFAGISVGTQLKGWASFNGNGADAVDAVTHIYPKVAKVLMPHTFPVLTFERPEFRAITVKAPNIIPVETYEGGA